MQGFVFEPGRVDPGIISSGFSWFDEVSFPPSVITIMAAGFIIHGNLPRPIESKSEKNDFIFDTVEFMTQYF